MAAVREQIPRWTLNAHPEPASRNHSRYAVHVVRRAPGWWAVEHLTDYLDRDGMWVGADNRADWRSCHEAKAAARELAPLVQVAGRTAEQSWAAEQAHKAVTR